MSLNPKTKRNAIIAFIIGLLIGIAILVGQWQQSEDGGKPVGTELSSDGAQFRQWLCDEGRIKVSECG